MLQNQENEVAQKPSGTDPGGHPELPGEEPRGSSGRTRAPGLRAPPPTTHAGQVCALPGPDARAPAWDSPFFSRALARALYPFPALSFFRSGHKCYLPRQIFTKLPIKKVTPLPTFHASLSCFLLGPTFRYVWVYLRSAPQVDHSGRASPKPASSL